MSDDEADEELLALLRKSLGIPDYGAPGPAETKVLEGAEHIYDNSIDVAIDMRGAKAAASTIWKSMQERKYGFNSWSEHELHPKAKNECTVDFIFLMDLLNFSFWSDKSDPEQAFAVEYRGKRWTGYWSLVAALQRALEEEIPITNPEYYVNETQCPDDLLKHVFRSATSEPIPLLSERISCIREAGQILDTRFSGTFTTCIEQAAGSATALVNILVNNFPCFRDEATFEGKTVHFYKRAQILVADLWACFEGKGYGYFEDIDKITMFADYRIPQMLHHLSCLTYSPPLSTHIRHLRPIASGHSWEIQLRGCSIWCIELIRREIELIRRREIELLRRRETDLRNGETNAQQHQGAKVNAILIDFFLYDTMKELEARGEGGVPHHRTRSIWY